MSEPSLEHVFSRRAEQWGESTPLYAALARTVAENARFAEPVAESAGPVWGRPSLYFAAVTKLLRTMVSDDPLVEYWPSLGGTRLPDAELPAVFTAAVTSHMEPLRAICRGKTGSRTNNPQAAAMLWPAIARYAAGKQVALIELGGTAGVALVPDRYGYRYGDVEVATERSLVLDTQLRGDTAPSEVDASVDVVKRIGLELEPVSIDDAEAVAWLRDGVNADHVETLAALDKALAELKAVDIDWRVGDYFETLAGALADVPDGVLPIVYGAHTLCCAEKPHRLPQIFAEAGKDLVWIAKEHPQNSLGLVCDEFAKPGHDTDAGADHSVVLSAVIYTNNQATQAWQLAKVDPASAWIDWSPKQVALS